MPRSLETILLTLNPVSTQVEFFLLYDRRGEPIYDAEVAGQNFLEHHRSKIGGIPTPHPKDRVEADTDRPDLGKIAV